VQTPDDEIDMPKGAHILPASVFTDDGPLDGLCFGGGWDWLVDTAQAVRKLYRVDESPSSRAEMLRSKTLGNSDSISLSHCIRFECIGTFWG
jgi:hypothetical protein